MVASPHGVLGLKCYETSAKFAITILVLKRGKLFSSCGKYVIYNWLASSVLNQKSWYDRIIFVWTGDNV